jgi:hypothetical protein
MKELHQFCIGCLKSTTMRKFFIFLTASIIGSGTFAQVRKIPAQVTDAFAKQYPNASKIEYEDNLLNVHVHFILDSLKWIAKYENDGAWKETEKQFSFDLLPADVEDGFQKSKYSRGWKVIETSIIYMPKDETRYRIKVEKGDVQKKYLFFDEKGSLIRDALTI